MAPRLTTVLRDLEVQRQRAEKYRADAAMGRRLAAIIKAHHYATVIEGDWTADEKLWEAAGIRVRCAHGHSLADAMVRSDGTTRCRTCHRERETARRQGRAVAA